MMKSEMIFKNTPVFEGYKKKKLLSGAFLNRYSEGILKFQGLFRIVVH